MKDTKYNSMNVTKEKYNGWTNYQTWNFKIWMENDQNDYRTILSKVEKKIIELKKVKETNPIRGQMPESWHKSIKYREASKILKDYAWEWVDNVVSSKASFVNDVLRYAINGINFYEIAQDIVDRVEEEMEVV